ncbi:MAG: phosphoglycerate kinase [Bacteroidota bacterium]
MHNFSIQDYHFREHKAFVRADLNVPTDTQGNITDDARIQATIPTIQQIRQGGGAVVLASHWGRPSGYEAQWSLKHLIPCLRQYLGTAVDFAPQCIGPDTAERIHQLSPSQVLLLENVRFCAGEQENNAAFAQALATGTTVYVNDAFATAHRAHASTTSMAAYFTDRLAGCLMQQELANIDKIVHHPRRPVTVIIGGNKIADKLLPIQRLLNQTDYLLVGGGVANTFQQALTSASLEEPLAACAQVPLAKELIRMVQQRPAQLLLPADVVAAPSLARGNAHKVFASGAVPAGWKALDIGPKTQQQFARIIQASATLLWSGPLGVFEETAFRSGTQAIAAAVANATMHGAFSLVGGGDSAAAVRHLGYEHQVSYISTGGSALLAYLGGAALPGVQALGRSC